ncbi:hypothetical protein AB8616_13365 [Marinomonas sp. RS-M-Aa-14]|uniref:hypothetical protein n=1 Tax=Marinomonas sp. RS-M-Aa-14 TaxID=3241169 RepID=UPI003AAED1FE
MSFHWLREVIHAQRNLANQRIKIPTLLCHSAASTIGKLTVEDVQQGDGVLDVESMVQAAKKTFTNLTQVSIAQGFHDLYLSHETARTTYLSAMSDWLKTLPHAP